MNSRLNNINTDTEVNMDAGQVLGGDIKTKDDRNLHMIQSAPQPENTLLFLKAPADIDLSSVHLPMYHNHI